MPTISLAGVCGSRSSTELSELARQFRDALKCYVINENTPTYARLLGETRQPNTIAQFFELLTDDQARAPEFIEPLIWASKQAATWGQPLMCTLGDRARRMLVRHHIHDKSIGLALSGMLFEQAGSQDAEDLLRQALASNPHREVQGLACYWLAMYLKNQAECIVRMRDREDESKLQVHFESMWDKEAVGRLKAKDPEKLLEEADGLFARSFEKYADVKTFGFENGDNLLRDSAGASLQEIRDLAPGKVAPDIIGEEADGKPLRLREYLGKVVLLTFSANWCGPCQAMYPHERELLERNKGKPFEILSVNTDLDRDTLQKAIRDGEITWRCWWDRPPRAIRKQWNVTSFPTVYVIDRAGVIRYKNVRGNALDEAVDSLLLEATRSLGDW